jgi:alanine-glyoxylate transaminase/serine-glyoxylate transaminase/serine-pyruvate transaminase
MAPYSHTPPGRHHLFVPGPTNVPDRVLRVMDRQSGACERTAPTQLALSCQRASAENHRDPHFSILATEVLTELKPLFKTTSGQCFVFPGAPSPWFVTLRRLLTHAARGPAQPPAPAPGRRV